MRPNRKGLLNKLPTVAICLCGEARVDSDDLMTGSLSLIFKKSEKRAPGGVHDAFCEMMVFDHAVDVQVLDGNVMILVGVLLSRLEVKITALTCDLEMRLGSIAGGLTASLAGGTADVVCASRFSARCDRIVGSLPSSQESRPGRLSSRRQSQYQGENIGREGVGLAALSRTR